MKRLVFEVSDQDAAAIEEAIVIRESWHCMPPIMHDDDNPRGMLIAEICRGWVERVTAESGECQ